MKKIVAIILTAIMILSLSACGGNGSGSSKEEKAVEKTEEKTEEKAEEKTEEKTEDGKTDLENAVSTESEEVSDESFEEMLIGKWIQIAAPGTESSIEFLDDHTATLNMLDNSYSLDWEIKGSIIQTSSFDINFKLNGKDAFTGNVNIVASNEALSVLTLDINGNLFQYTHA